MRVIAKIMEFIGMFILLIGVGAMDNDVSTIIPIAMLVTGMALAFSGAVLEGSMYERTSR